MQWQSREAFELLLCGGRHLHGTNARASEHLKAATEALWGSLGASGLVNTVVTWPAWHKTPWRHVRPGSLAYCVTTNEGNLDLEPRACLVPEARFRGAR